MDTPFVPLFFALTSIGIVTTFLALQLKNDYPYRFLVYFMYFVLFFNIYGFVKFTGGVFVSVLGGSSANLFPTIIIILPIIYAPAVILYMYMLFRWIWELMDRRMSRALLIIFWGLQAAAYSCYITGILQYSTKTDITTWLISLRDFILIPLLFSPLVYLITQIPSIRDVGRKRLLAVLGTYYLTGFILYFVMLFARFPYYHNANHYYCIMTFVHFILHLPPLLYLRRFLKNRGPELAMRIREDEKRGMDVLFTKFEITDRERAIVLLIMEGKSNAEIGRELFIATKTVKNNIFNIYRKTGVKNRVQLSNLLRGS